MRKISNHPVVLRSCIRMALLFMSGCSDDDTSIASEASPSTVEDKTWDYEDDMDKTVRPRRRVLALYLGGWIDKHPAPDYSFLGEVPDVVLAEISKLYEQIQNPVYIELQRQTQVDQEEAQAATLDYIKRLILLTDRHGFTKKV